MISTFSCILRRPIHDQFFSWKFIYEVYSLSAINALNVSVVKSKYLDDCIQSLTLTSYHQVELIWVPEHHGIRGNEKANECAVRGSLDEATTCNDILTPLSIVYSLGMSTEFA